jgi:hypothetical protein
VLLDAAGADACLVAIPCAAESGRAASVIGADVQVVAVADDPHRHRPAQCSFAPYGRKVQLLRGVDRFGFIVRPAGHRSVLDLEWVVLGVDELGVGAAARAGVEGVDCRDLVGREDEVRAVTMPG